MTTDHTTTMIWVNYTQMEGLGDLACCYVRQVVACREHMYSKRDVRAATCTSGHPPSLECLSHSRLARTPKSGIGQPASCHACYAPCAAR